MEAHAGERSDSGVEIEIAGLSVYTHHGVTDAEQEVGQRLEIDIVLILGECEATATDRLEDTADYSEASEIAARAATETSYRTLERLSGVIAERLISRFECDAVRVRAAKPEPPVELSVDRVSVELTRRAGER